MGLRKTVCRLGAWLGLFCLSLSGLSLSGSVLSRSVLAADEPVSSEVTEPELQSELLARRERDQQARRAFIEFMKAHGQDGRFEVGAEGSELSQRLTEIQTRLLKIDRENTGWLEELVEQRGWPTIEEVGESGSQAAWLLVQHADQHAEFQRRCLDLMVELPKDQVSQKNIAYLTDRVLLAEGKKQRYGTQFTSQDGRMVPSPLEDPESVDARRAAVGLPSLEEYRREIEKLYGGEKASSTENEQGQSSDESDGEAGR